MGAFILRLSRAWGYASVGVFEGIHIFRFKFVFAEGSGGDFDFPPLILLHLHNPLKTIPLGDS